MQIEALCKLITTVGSKLEQEDQKSPQPRMQVYFDLISQLTRHAELPPRIRFMCKDVIELREKKWTLRAVDAALDKATATLSLAEARAAILAQQAKEQRERDALVVKHATDDRRGGGGGGRGGGGGGDRRGDGYGGLAPVAAARQHGRGPPPGGDGLGMGGGAGAGAGSASAAGAGAGSGDARLASAASSKYQGQGPAGRGPATFGAARRPATPAAAPAPAPAGVGAGPGPGPGSEGDWQAVPARGGRSGGPAGPSGHGGGGGGGGRGGGGAGAPPLPAGQPGPLSLRTPSVLSTGSVGTAGSSSPGAAGGSGGSAGGPSSAGAGAGAGAGGDAEPVSEAMRVRRLEGEELEKRCHGLLNEYTQLHSEAELTKSVREIADSPRMHATLVRRALETCHDHPKEWRGGVGQALLLLARHEPQPLLRTRDVVDGFRDYVKAFKETAGEQPRLPEFVAEVSMTVLKLIVTSVVVVGCN